MCILHTSYKRSSRGTMTRKDAIKQLFLMPLILVSNILARDKKSEISKGNVEILNALVDDSKEIVGITVSDAGEIFPEATITYHLDKIEFICYFKGQKKVFTGAELFEAL